MSFTILKKFILFIFIMSFVLGLISFLSERSSPTPTPKEMVLIERKPGAAVASMAKKVDKVEGITWYQDQSSPKSLNKSIVMLYMGDDEKRPWLRFRIQHYADDWLFIKTAIFVVDGVKRGVASGRWERDNGSHIFEWLDVQVDDEQRKLIDDIANGSEVIMRLEGRHYSKDRVLSKSEQAAMKNVLKAYFELGGR